jgi:hypothetical protein
MRKCPRKAGLIIGSILAVTLLFNSVVYACSKISMVMAMPGTTMAMTTTDDMGDAALARDPCTQHKQDVCKSIRDRLLSIQPSLYKVDPAQQSIVILLPDHLVAKIPSDIAVPFSSLTWQTAFHSVFKLPLPLSLSVLRL